MDQADKVRDVDFIDNIICAEIPDRNTYPDLYDVVISNMIHGPCGSGPLTHPDSLCMKDGKCSKRYPREFCNETISNEDSYPIYRRREVIGRERCKVKVKGIFLNNQ